MADDIQNLIAERWSTVTTENLGELADFAGYQESFHRLFGFGLAGVDYSADVDVQISIPSIKA
jgi:enoyl-[acyl-carrier protein] reductase/trans-2-enoyl-CoA reductase (NAD+)